MILDLNGTGFIKMVLGVANCFYFSNFTIDELGNSFVMWRNKIKVRDMAAKENNIPDHNKSEKLDKIYFFETCVLNNCFTDTTLFGMRKNNLSPIVIGDGIHRAIGIYRAYLRNNNIQDKLNLRLLIFEGEQIYELDDYKQSFLEE